MRFRRDVTTAAVAAGAVLAAAAGAGEAGPGASAPDVGPARGAGPGTVRAVIVTGMPGSEVYARRYRDWATRFREHLVKAGVPEGNVAVLAGDKDFRAPFVKGEATRESVLANVADAAAKTAPGDQIILVLIGHGVVTATPPTFVVRGRDPNAEEIAKALDKARARNQVVLNLSAAGGVSLKHFAKAGRVNVAANSPREGNEPVFAEFYLRALESKRADDPDQPGTGDGDGRVSVLEAHNWATFQTAQWISRQSYVVDSGWRLDGRESVEIFHKLCDGPRGAPGARVLAPASRGDVPDVRVQIRPEGFMTAEWAMRRVLGERATLEDSGAEVGSSALTSWVPSPDDPFAATDGGYTALQGEKPGDPGHLAAQVVLGSPALLAGKK